MTPENKDLLLKDLCARLPYGVKCCIYNFGENTIRIKEDILWSVQGDNILTLKSCVEKGEAYMYHQIKPYLLPLSSMSESQKQEFFKIAGYEVREEDCGRHTEMYYYDLVGHENTLCPNYAAIDWLNAHHFDYRGLINKGLAIDATNLNIY